MSYNSYIIDKNFTKIFDYLGISERVVLKRAEMPLDTFNKKSISISTTKYNDLLNALNWASKSKTLAITLGCFENVETFNPPIFASYCSRNGLTCIQRLAEYKQLVGPLSFKIEDNNDVIYLEIIPDDNIVCNAQFIIDVEMVFIVNLLRLATKVEISPVEILTSNNSLDNEFNTFFKIKPTKSNKNVLVFAKSDLELIFTSQNELMWEYFEPELKKRLNEMEVDESYSAKTRSALTELLPAGECTIDKVASMLGLSTRTLQRKLKDENTTFQKQLNHTRELLARHYLKDNNISLDDVTFLLCFQDLASFTRAFKIWTGLSVTEYRANF